MKWLDRRFFLDVTENQKVLTERSNIKVTVKTIKKVRACIRVASRIDKIFQLQGKHYPLTNDIIMVNCVLQVCAK